MTSKAIQRPIAMAMASVFILSACVTTNPDGSTKLDDKASAALIGAAAGCAVGVAASKNGGKGCLVGAAVGAAGFAVWKYLNEHPDLFARSEDESDDDDIDADEYDGPTAPDVPPVVN